MVTPTLLPLFHPSYAKMRQSNTNRPLCKARWIGPKATVHVLIDMTANHPGAGSYAIDDCLAECHIKALVELRRNLPVAMSDKEKEKH
jgi:hypothetical protein